MATYGETLVTSFLKKLPEEKFQWFAEPQMPNSDNAYKNPDFVVVSADLGVFVIEVKDYVEIIVADQREILIKKRDGEEITEPNPSLTARKYAQNLSDKFKKRNELLSRTHKGEQLKFPYMSVVILPNIPRRIIDQFIEADIWERNTVWGKEDIQFGEPVDLFYQIKRPFHQSQPLTAHEIDIMRGVINPQVIVRDTKGTDVGTLTRQQEELAFEELMDKSVISKLAENNYLRLVRGIAGSGKSLVLQKRARYVAENYPGSKVLVLMFNEKLAEYTAKRLIDVPQIHVVHFHKLCSQLIKESQASWPRDIISASDYIENQYAAAANELGLDSTYISQEFEWILESGIQSRDEYLNAIREGRGKALNRIRREKIFDLFTQYTGHKKLSRQYDWADISVLTNNALNEKRHKSYFDAILVDEAQDFAPSWFSVVQKMLLPNGLLFICDDPTQTLWRNFTWKQRGLEVRGRTRILRIPFRCTRQITDAAHALLMSDENLKYGDEIIQPDLTSFQLRTGPRPILRRFSDRTNEARIILNEIEKSENHAEIAVLCHSKRFIKDFAYLRNKGVNVLTFNEMKGQEFRIVYIPHLENSFDRANSTGDLQETSDTRKRIYTAMTRARDLLIMSYSGAFPTQLQPIVDYVDVIK